jgi:hypothetical protein
MDNYSNNINNQIPRNLNDGAFQECIGISALIAAGVAFASLPICTNVPISMAGIISGPLFCGAATLSVCGYNDINDYKEYLKAQYRACVEGDNQPVELQEMQ